MQPGVKCFVLFVVCGVFYTPAEVLAGHGEPDTANFVLVKENNGITIYERWYSIKPDQQVREIKATFSVKAQPQAAAALIKDESRGKRWNKNTCAYRIVLQNEHIWFGYIQYDLPWPVSNQDCVLQYSQNFSGNSLEIRFKETDHPSFPIQKRIQRIPVINGKWIFKETSNGTFVEYYISTPPSRTLPSWLTDPLIRNNLIETLNVFRRILENDDH